MIGEARIDFNGEEGDDRGFAPVALPDSPDAELAQAELEDGLREWATDQAVQAADDAHRGELAAAYAEAKEAVGVAVVKVGRELRYGDGEDGRGCAVHHSTVVEGQRMVVFGVGVSPREAATDALAQLDRDHVRVEGGAVRVKGVAVVQAAPYRSDRDALALARRIALNPEYLEAALWLRMPGVSEERPPQTAAPAVA